MIDRIGVITLVASSLHPKPKRSCQTQTERWLRIVEQYVRSHPGGSGNCTYGVLGKIGPYNLKLFVEIIAFAREVKAGRHTIYNHT